MPKAATGGGCHWPGAPNVHWGGAPRTGAEFLLTPSSHCWPPPAVRGRHCGPSTAFSLPPDERGRQMRTLVPPGRHRLAQRSPARSKGCQQRRQQQR